MCVSIFAINDTGIMSNFKTKTIAAKRAIVNTNAPWAILPSSACGKALKMSQ